MKTLPMRVRSARKTTESFPMYALQLLNTLSREKVSGQYLLSNGAIESLQTLRKSPNCPDIFDIIDEIIEDLQDPWLEIQNAKFPGALMSQVTWELWELKRFV